MAKRRKAYVATSLSGAQDRVRRLENHVKRLTDLLDRYAADRKLMAMVAADGPAFTNPLQAMAAKQRRDEILRDGCRLKPDGSPL